MTRTDWLNQFDQCWRCERHVSEVFQRKLQCHEIARGVHREKAVLSPACWYCACGECHIGIGLGTIAEQLAMKKLKDPENYDLKAFIEIYRPNSTPQYKVDLEAEIEKELRKMTGESV